MTRFTGLRSPRRARARQVRAAIAALLLLPGATGCYTYVPVWNGTAAAGSEVSLAVTDRGRVALSGPLGPGVRAVTGQIAEATDSAYVLRVTQVSYIDNAMPAKWSGERITVARDYVSGVSERRLSKSRSWLATGLIAVGVAIATTVVIRGVAGPDPSTKPDGGGPVQQ